MYKTFELFQKAIYIIAFWSLVGFVLETRKIGTSFVDVTLSTIMGWCVFLTIICLFLLFVTSSHAKHKAEKKRKITHEVVEDGMTFTVGGHTKFDPVLPESYMIESQTLINYKDNQNEENINKALLQSVSAVKELLMQEENKKPISENELFDRNEGDGKEIYGEEAKPNLQFGSVNDSDPTQIGDFVKQSDEDIAKEANKGYVAPQQISDTDNSRAIDKGILYYETQFNALYSYVVNHKQFELAEGIRKGKIIIVNQQPDNPQDELYRGKKILTKEEHQAKVIKLKAEAAALRAQIDETLEKVLDTIPKFKYTGIETTTPIIKAKKQYDFSKYQLLIFTALFPYASWMLIRSNRALNILDPKIAKHLSPEELKKLDKSELGLSLRDKRILFNARRMYDIYLHRDKELAESGMSSYNMPFTYDEKGNKVNTLEEAVALCEFLRKALTVKAVKIKPKNTAKKQRNAQYNDGDLIGIMSRLFHEKNRFNTQNADTRIGIIKNDLLYIDYDSFAPKFNGLFGQRFPHLANNNEYTNAQYALYKKLAAMGLLAMRKRKESELVETYEFFDKGELFSIYWDFGKGSNGVTVENTLIIHAAQMFKDLVPMNQESSAVPRIMGVSQGRAIPHSPYSKQIQSLIEQDEKEKKRAKAIQEEIIKQNTDQIKPDVNTSLNELNSLTGDNTTEVIAVEGTTTVVPATIEADSKPQANIEADTSKKSESKATDQPSSEDEEQKIMEDAEKVLRLFKANKTDHQIASKLLKKSVVKNAEVFLDKTVQVLRLRIAPSHEDIEVMKSNELHHGRRYNFAVHERKQDICLIKYSRGTVNEYAKTIDLTILKLLAVSRSKHYIADDTFTYSKDSNHLIITSNNIGRIFNVYEQMAIFQKQGESKLWKSVKGDFKTNGKDKNEQYDQIQVIECVEFSESSEESIYRKMEADLWDEQKATELFKKLDEKLNSMRNQLARLQITYNRDTNHYVIPKGMLGKLNRLGIEVNSFLAYIDQFKSQGELKAELTKFSNALFAFESDGITKVNFMMIEGL